MEDRRVIGALLAGVSLLPAGVGAAFLIWADQRLYRDTLRNLVQLAGNLAVGFGALLLLVAVAVALWPSRSRS